MATISIFINIFPFFFNFWDNNMIKSFSPAFSSLQTLDIFVLNAVMVNLHCQLAHQGKGNLNWRTASIKWPVGCLWDIFLMANWCRRAHPQVVMPSLGRWSKLRGSLWTSQPSRKHCSSLVSASVSASNPYSGFSQWWIWKKKTFPPVHWFWSVFYHDQTKTKLINLQAI